MTSQEKQLLISLSEEINVPYEWLYNLIQFESGFNPGAENPVSSAKGLLQFIDSTAVQLGYKDSLDLIQKHPTVESQLVSPVRTYLLSQAPFPTKQSLYMAVFYPAYKYVEPERVFPKRVQDSNPGIKTPADYIEKVDSKFPKLPAPGLSFIAVLGIAGLLFIILTQQKGKK